MVRIKNPNQNSPSVLTIPISQLFLRLFSLYFFNLFYFSFNVLEIKFDVKPLFLSLSRLFFENYKNDVAVFENGNSISIFPDF